MGIYYNGPPTTAIAGYYCVVEAIGSTMGGYGGWSTRLSVELSNGAVVEDTYVPYYLPNGSITGWGLEDEFLIPRSRETYEIAHSMLMSVNLTCGWLIIKVIGSIVFIGYHMPNQPINIWYDSYVMNTSVLIEPGPSTKLLFTSPYNYGAFNPRKLLIYLSMYYWDGKSWRPAPVMLINEAATGYVTHAWIYINNNCLIAYWPQSINESACIIQPPPPP